MSVQSALGIRQNHLRATIASGDALDVRQYTVQERMSALFVVTVVAHADDPNIEFDAVVGKEASLTVETRGEPRIWRGVCNHIQQIGAEEGGYSTYQISIVPTLWFATQRRNHRMFQQISEPDIALKLLGEWGIEPTVRFDKGSYKKRKYRVQYGESDFDFICRLLEDAGISFFFEQRDGKTELVLADAPQRAAPRGQAIPFKDSPSANTGRGEHVTAVRVAQETRAGKYTMRDHDYRLPPSYKLLATAQGGLPEEGRLERFHYTPGAFLFGGDRGESTSVADDKGKTRTDEGEGAALSRKRLEAKRGGAKVVTFQTNVLDLAPGVVVSVEDHPRAELSKGKKLLIVGVGMSGDSHGEGRAHCEARSADLAYRPPLVTPKPKVSGVESATVVGPAGEEIHTDEFGRVRVHFHWDRESNMNEGSSCWIHVSQPWGGAGYGGSNIPRVGQEVIIDFLGGDPDRPVIIGRVYTNLQKTPYKLPDNKTQSGWKSNSSPSTGGYNEIMFEDKAGQELVRMQAEKDLTKLVKHDESVTIGNDRTKSVGHDDALQVGHDRTRQVGHDETVAIGNDRARQVGHDETVAIGNDRTRQVGHDEAVAIGNDRTKSIGGNESMEVAKNQSETIGMNRSRAVGVNESVEIGASQQVAIGASQQVEIGASQQVAIGASQRVEIGASQQVAIGESQSLAVGGTQSVTVTKAASEMVGLAKSLTVGGAYAVTVGGAMSTTVGLIQTEQVGLSKTVTVGEKIEIVCGAAKIVLEASGKIAITGTEISIEGSKTKIVGDPIDLN